MQDGSEVVELAISFMPRRRPESWQHATIQLAPKLESRVDHV
jgi:hypothetical protein